MKKDLVSHFERCALLSAEKREKLRTVAGEHFLELDLDEGIARFGTDLAVRMQVLGTESEHTLTWLWAWAEEQTELPPALTAASRDATSWMERNGLAQFALPSIDLNSADGIVLSLIAAEVCRASAFYRDPYEGGALFLLFYDSRIDAQPSFSRAGLLRNLADLAQQYDFDHRNALLSYFGGKGIACSAAEHSISAELESGERLIAEFDGDNRVTAVNGRPLN